MIQDLFLNSLKLLQSLQLPNGGFPYFPGETAKPDATAWAVMSMAAHEFDEEGCSSGRKYLVSQQTSDGRVSISPTNPDASWPTPLVVLAWEGFPQYQQSQKHAIDYLLGFTGRHFPNPAPTLIGHDTSIQGWPWIVGTHSWVIPTSLTLVALRQVNLGRHPRVHEAQSLLIDRQLPHGGWNYGNTIVLGKELPPLPEETSIALHALAGMTERHLIERSLTYMLEQYRNLRTPLSLGWALLSLSAWDLRPTNTEDLILACLHRQKRYGPYPLPSLALLLCAMKATHGLHLLFNTSLRTNISSAQSY